MPAFGGDLNGSKARIVDPIGAWKHPVEVVETPVLEKQHDDMADPVETRVALRWRRRPTRI